MEVLLLIIFIFAIAFLILRWLDKRKPERSKKGFLNLKDNLGFNISPISATILGLLLLIIFYGGIIGSIGGLIFILGLINLFRRKSNKDEKDVDNSFNK